MELIYTDKDGNTTKYTPDMLTAAIEERNKLRTESAEVWAIAQKHLKQLIDNRNKVYDFFNERYDSSDSVIRAEVDDVNDLLESIGSEKLKRLYTVTGSISFTITDVEAESEEDARDMVESELSLDFNGNGSLDDWDVDVHDTNEQ